MMGMLVLLKSLLGFSSQKFLNSIIYKPHVSGLYAGIVSKSFF